MMAKERPERERKEKKDKKEKRERSPAVEQAIEVQDEGVSSAPDATNEDVDMVGAETQAEPKIKKERVKLADRPVGALVPFANPLADEKTTKKLLKGVNKAAKSRAIKRGVKEVVKVLRKSPLVKPSAPEVRGIAILAADISPMDVISHLPVLCEDHGVPYIYVQSRAELGAACSTKRPTSVVYITRERSKGGVVRARKKDGDEEMDEARLKGQDEEREKETEAEWKEIWQELVKLVQKEATNVRI